MHRPLIGPDDLAGTSGELTASRGQSGGLVFDGRFRVAFVLFGGMLALQSSPNLDATKIGYLVGALLCLVAALTAVWSARTTPAIKLRAPWIAASTALALLIAMSFLVAQGEGTSTIDWMRDVAAYGLFAAVPIFALDAEVSASRKLLVGMLVIAGLMGGLAWAVEWLGRRQILELPIERLVFPSGQLPGMLYLFAMATAFTAGKRSLRWGLLAGVILGLFLITGTRSSLLLLIGPLVMAVLAGRTHLRSTLIALASHAVVAVVVVIAFQFALELPALVEADRGSPVQSGSPDPPSVIGERLGTVPAVLGNMSSDPSFKERLAQYQAAWALFASSPIVGVGPGHSIEWINVSGQPQTGYEADTPLVLPAKFGILGVLVFLGAAAAYVSTVVIALRKDRRSGITLTLFGYGVWTIVGLPLGFAVEDKGASLALMLLLALAFVGTRPPGIDSSEVEPRANASV
jgi:O-antigen ligase